MREFSMKTKLFLAIVICYAYSSFGQLNINQLNTDYVIDFTGYAGLGFQPNPLPGELSSLMWAVTGSASGDLEFGGTQNTPGTFYTGGLITGPASGNGLYALDDNGNIRFLIQPTSDHWTPGTLTLRIKNNTNQTITSLSISYDLFIRNDQVRSNYFNFSYSSDHNNYINIPELNYTSPADPDQLGVVFVGNKAATITGISISPNSFFYLRWYGDDISGSGQRDEFILDNIKVRGSSQAGIVANPAFINASTISANSIRLNWQKNSSNNDVLIAFSTDSVFGNPSGSYNVGDLIQGGGRVIYEGGATTYLHSNLIAGTKYFYKIWSFNSSYTYSQGLTTSAMTYNIYPSLKVNEFMALNTLFPSPQGTPQDWIEIYNPSSNPVNIGGWYMTDNLNAPTKHRIPSNRPDSTTIPAGGFMLLWADDSPSNGVRHLAFALSRNGEAIGLFGPDGLTPVDTLSFGYQYSDTSYGRAVDGTGNFIFFLVSSPGASNSNGIPLSVFDNYSDLIPTEIKLFDAFPNPFNPSTTISWQMSNSGYVSIKLFNLLGQEVSNIADGYYFEGVHSIKFLPNFSLPSGVYFYQLTVKEKESSLTEIFRETKKLVLMK